MEKSTEHQTLALAGVMQAAELVNTVATEGRCDEARARASIDSLFTLEADSIGDVYGGINQLRDGLLGLQQQLGTQGITNLDVVRYYMGLLNIERRFIRDSNMADAVRKGLTNIQRDAELHELPQRQVRAKLSALYQETVSTLTPRIIVKGNPRHLQNEDITNDVRALLFAGLRSAVLWRQCGGRRWHTLFGRGATLRAAARLLNQ